MKDHGGIKLNLTGQDDDYVTYSGENTFLQTRKEKVTQDGNPPATINVEISIAEGEKANDGNHRHEAAIQGTLEQINQVKAMLGENYVHNMVVGDNGIATFWNEGPQLLAVLRNALGIEKGHPENDWNSFTPWQKDAIAGIAAGSLDWAIESHLDTEYVKEWINADQEIVKLISQRTE